MKKSEIIFIIALAILVIGFFVFRGGFGFEKDRYSAVYLNSGEIYFGKLSSSFGWFKLTDVYLLQRDEKGLNLNRFKDVVWQPAEPLNIKKDKVVFWSYLTETSPVIQAIQQRAVQEKAALEAQQKQAQQSQPSTQTPSATSTQPTIPPVQP